ncbi:5-(carboxyamino)imidazole ribonucleotide synthase [Photobacterium chitinilyticum]|uniref:5-(carboxyamino)imidazole ribonucleotide synthase n=1 Tax=Photobacterium chitinilyticum TaxID=2485123 RepID=UPI003D129957
MKVLVLGAGQLARMMALAGAPLNIEVFAYDVSSGHVVHPLTQQLMMKGLNTAITYANVITAEFEHIPHDILDACAASGKFRPTTEAIKAGGDRRLEKRLLDNADVANAKYQIINTRDDLDRAIDAVGIPMVLKSALGGYDGKGQWRLKSHEDTDQIWQEIDSFLAATPDQAIVAEEFVSFDREVSLIGARGEDGSMAIYSLTENIHINGVLSLSMAVEGNSELQNQAEAMFFALAESLDYIGVLAIEFFDVGGRLLVNEIAPRVHNSGHWTQQGAETCQFENHLRAVCGMPLGDTSLLRPTAMVNILGEDTLPNTIMALPQCHIHWYGKEKRPGRKMGHINVCANSTADLKTTLDELADHLDPIAFPAVRQ